MQLAVDAGSLDLMPTNKGVVVKRKKVGPLETEYDTASSTGSPVLTAAMSFITPLLNNGSQGFGLTVIRA